MSVHSIPKASMRIFLDIWFLLSIFFQFVVMVLAINAQKYILLYLRVRNNLLQVKEYMNSKKSRLYN